MKSFAFGMPVQPLTQSWPEENVCAWRLRGRGTDSILGNKLDGRRSGVKERAQCL